MNARVKERVAFALMTLCTVLVLIPVLLIPLYILARGIGALSWEFLTQPPREGMLAGGIMPPLVGTLMLVFGVIVVAVPLGVLSAVYLSEYARQGRWVRIIRLAIINLAGVPSVVYGLFGLGLFVLFLKLGTSLISGILTLSVLVLPIIITSTEEALRVVPQSYREASYAMGATRWQTLSRITLPQALGGIITGTILSIGRAAGETAPIMFTAAAFDLPHLPKSVKDPIMALPYHLYIISTQVPDAPPRIQWGTALVLLLLVLSMSLIAALVRARVRKNLRW
ncbi:MAG: phosphate ABC transporter permease PstA [Armatimonadetes bacterium]|nr:phosphate ABC transporter permease PstA [Armatimonadota bacterium]